MLISKASVKRTCSSSGASSALSRPKLRKRLRGDSAWQGGLAWR